MGVATMMTSGRCSPASSSSRFVWTAVVAGRSPGAGGGLGVGHGNKVHLALVAEPFEVPQMVRTETVNSHEGDPGRGGGPGGSASPEGCWTTGGLGVHGSPRLAATMARDAVAVSSQKCWGGGIRLHLSKRFPAIGYVQFSSITLKM